MTILKVIARIPRTNSLPRRPVNRLYLDERVQNKNEATKDITIVNYNEKESSSYCGWVFRVAKSTLLEKMYEILEY